MWLHTTSHVLLQLLPTFWTFKTKRIYKIIFSLSIVLLESKEEKCLLQTWGDVMISNYLHRKQMQVMIYRWTFNSIPFKHNFSILHETLNIKPHRSVNRHLMWCVIFLHLSQTNLLQYKTLKNTNAARYPTLATLSMLTGLATNTGNWILDNLGVPSLSMRLLYRRFDVRRKKLPP